MKVNVTFDKKKTQFVPFCTVLSLFLKGAMRKRKDNKIVVHELADSDSFIFESTQYSKIIFRVKGCVIFYVKIVFHLVDFLLLSLYIITCLVTFIT